MAMLIARKRPTCWSEMRVLYYFLVILSIVFLYNPLGVEKGYKTLLNLFINQSRCLTGDNNYCYSSAWGLVNIINRIWIWDASPYCHLPTLLVNIHGILWNPMQSYGNLWNPMESSRILWNPVESYGILLNLMEPYGILWSPMDSFVFPWILMDSYDFSLFLWTPIGFPCMIPMDDSYGFLTDSNVFLQSFSEFPSICMDSYVFLCIPVGP